MQEGRQLWTRDVFGRIRIQNFRSKCRILLIYLIFRKIYKQKTWSLSHCRGRVDHKQTEKKRRKKSVIFFFKRIFVIILQKY